MGDLADEYDGLDYIDPQEIDEDAGKAAALSRLFSRQPERHGGAVGLFQIARPMRSDMSEFGPDRVNVVASPHMPPGKAFMVGADPTRDDAATVVIVDEASEFFADVARKGRKTGFYTDWATQRFPSLERFIEKYSKFVPHETDNPKEKYTMDMSGIAKMRGDLEEMLAKFTSMVAIVERFGGEPGEGSVIKFEHSFDDFGRTEDPKVYDYVAVRKFGKWYVSGRPFVGRAVKWAELLEFIGDARAWVCREFKEVPMPGASAGVDVDAKAEVVKLLTESAGTDSIDAMAEKLLDLVNKSK